MEPYSLRFYRLLLRLYPEQFREQYGPEMVLFFRLSLQEAVEKDRTFSFWLSTLWEAVVSSVRIRMTEGWGAAGVKLSALAGVGLALVLTVNLLFAMSCSSGCVPFYPNPIWRAWGLLETLLTAWILFGIYLAGPKGWLEKIGLVALCVVACGSATILLFGPAFYSGDQIPSLPAFLLPMSTVVLWAGIVLSLALALGRLHMGGEQTLMGWILLTHVGLTFGLRAANSAWGFSQSLTVLSLALGVGFTLLLTVALWRSTYPRTPQTA